MRKLLGAAQDWGWALSIVVAVTALGIAYSNATSVIPVVGFDAKPESTVPYNPGDNFDTLKYCEHPDTKVVYGIEPEAGGNELQLNKGVEQIIWKDTLPFGSNPAATYYWINSDGNQDDTAVEMTTLSAECAYRKAGEDRR